MVNILLVVMGVCKHDWYGRCDRNNYFISYPQNAYYFHEYMSSKIISELKENVGNKFHPFIQTKLID